ncbi:thioesterase family protein [Amphibacillus sp. Q70]|uniref:thioesterase family protein n=1 Tax=Amphibacillus sp. Q70 TaxID=3453416 RepID=UPI003F83CF40
MTETFIKEFQVTEKHAASKVGSGGLEVLSTPSMIAFMENTAYEQSKSFLTNEETTVGIEIQVKHIAPTAIGKTVQVKARFLERKKRILTFQVDVYDGELLIGAAEHKRAIVIGERFMKNIQH